MRAMSVVLLSLLLTTCLARSSATPRLRSSESQAAAPRALVSVHSHSANSSQHVHQVVTNDVRKAAHWDCEVACGDGVDSSCVPACEAEMFACYDHDQPEEASHIDECKNEVAKKYKDFGKNWDSEHDSAHSLVYHTHHHEVTVDERHIVEAKCKAACGAEADSSCIPQCSTELYECFDNTSNGTEQVNEECQATVIKKYKAFVADWNDTHGKR